MRWFAPTLAALLWAGTAHAQSGTWSQSVINAQNATTPGPGDYWPLVQGGVTTHVVGNLVLYANNNLSDVANIATALGNLGLGQGNTPVFTGLTLTSMASAGFHCVHASASGLLGVVGQDCGTGGGGGGSPVNWPPSGNLVISNFSNSPSGLAPIPNELLVASAGGAWRALPTAASAALCTDGAGVPSLCSSATMKSLLGYQTANAAITLAGDTTGGPGTTALTTTTGKVNGVAFPAAPATNTVPAVTGSNTVSYQTAAQLAAMSGFGDMLTQSHGAVNITGGTVTGLAAAVNPGDVPNKAYVDAAITGAIIHTQVLAATAAALPNTPVVATGTGVGKTLTAAANAALVIDGYTVLLNDRVLVKNEATGANNGIYTQTTLGVGGSVKWVLTRATDFDQAVAGEVALGAYVFVVNGTANAGSQWQLGAPTPSSITVDTTALTFNKLNATVSLSADGTSILNTSGVLSVLPSGALDILGSTRGSILKRGATGWTVTTPGTATFLWTSNGAGADPTWQAAPASGVSGQASGKLAIGGSATTITGNIGYANTSTANTILEMDAGGLVPVNALPLATSAAFGAMKCGAGTTCTGGVVTATAGGDTGTTGITAAGTTLASATDLTTQQNYVSAGANCLTPLTTGCAGTAAVRFDAALMVPFNHLYVCDEDPVNAVLVYPDTVAHFINNQPAGVGIPVDPNQCGHFIVKSATTLRTVP